MRKLLWLGGITAIATASALVLFSAFGPADGEVRVSGAASPFPLHFWISNQSLGTGVEEVQIRVALDGPVIFDQFMAVGMQHNVAEVDQTVDSGEHTVNVSVPSHSLTTQEVIDVQGETWVLIAFFYDPQSAHAAQHTPTIQVTVFDTEPGIK